MYLELIGYPIKNAWQVDVRSNNRKIDLSILRDYDGLMILRATALLPRAEMEKSLTQERSRWFSSVLFAPIFHGVSSENESMNILP